MKTLEKPTLRESIGVGLYWNRANELFRKTNAGTIESLTKVKLWGSQLDKGSRET
jgi:hypothetical protein